MKKILTAAIAAVLVVVPEAASSHQAGMSHTYKHLYYKVQRTLGTRAPGRQIVSHGVATKHGVRAATKAEIAKSIRQLRKLLAPPPVYLKRVAVQPTLKPAGVETASVQAGYPLSAIASCESGGDPGAVSSGGAYRGKYQFDYRTWASVGGTGDPAAASEQEQDRRASLLYAQRGSSPWPVCGR